MLAETAPSGAPTPSRAWSSGTVGYMSPEQVRAEPADHRSDIFAFGSIFYEMLTGTPRLPRATRRSRR